MDILDRLREAMELRPGTADSDVNAIDIPVPIHRDLLRDAIAEITRLRSLAGAVSPGPDAAEVLKPLRHKAPSEHERA